MDPGIRLQQPSLSSQFYLYLSSAAIKSLTCLNYPTCSSAPMQL